MFVVRSANGRLFWKQKSAFTGIWVQHAKDATQYPTRRAAHEAADMHGEAQVVESGE